MKTFGSFLTLVMITVFFSTDIFSQSNAKVIGVINKAEWCGTCRKNDARAKAAFMENNKDGAVLFVANDLTNGSTKKASIEKLKSHGLEGQMKKRKGTGVVYFFNAETKELINKISVSKSDSELAKAVHHAKAGVKK